MYATEFQTVVTEPYIKIPNFDKFKGHKIRVVLLDLIDDNSEVENSKSFIENLIDNPRTFSKDFKFDRDEANER